MVQPWLKSMCIYGKRLNVDLQWNWTEMSCWVVTEAIFGFSLHVVLSKYLTNDEQSKIVRERERESVCVIYLRSVLLCRLYAYIEPWICSLGHTKISPLSACIWCIDSVEINYRNIKKTSQLLPQFVI